VVGEGVEVGEGGHVVGGCCGECFVEMALTVRGGGDTYVQFFNNDLVLGGGFLAGQPAGEEQCEDREVWTDKEMELKENGDAVDRIAVLWVINRTNWHRTRFNTIRKSNSSLNSVSKHVQASEPFTHLEPPMIPFRLTSS